MNLDALLSQAWQARQRSYSPYSHFAVGAAVLTAEGDIFVGCNVENASYGLTTCAERVAVFAAVAGGARHVRAIAIVADAPSIAMPCGACLQVLAEFALEHEPLVLVLENLAEERTLITLSDLLPRPFRLRHGRGRAEAPEI